MSCGIYKITNKLNGHSYIGLSKNIEKRFLDHKTKAFGSNRKDDVKKVLYQAIRKYGLENFSFDIIEECDEESLKRREIYWIAYYNTYLDKNNYNLTPGGDMPSKNTIHIGEDHGMAKLTEEDVIYCRKCYQMGLRSRDIYNESFQEKIAWSGFLRMWHGKNWKHIMPEVFKSNPHRGKYGAKDRDFLTEAFKESGLSLNQFQKSSTCYVGYGTLHNMINNPNFYDDK